MAYKTGDVVIMDFCTQSATGAATDADSLPTGTLVINGTDNAATVTVTHKTTGNYKASVTLPTISEADTLTIRVAATVGGVAGKGIVWGGVGTTKRVLDLHDLGGTAQTGDVYALANGANGFAAIKSDTATILIDVGTGSGAIYAIVSNGIYGNAALHTQIGSPMQVGNVIVGGYASGQDPGTLVGAINVAGKSLVNSIRYIGAGITGLSSGVGSATETFKDFAGSNAIQVTYDVSSNRTIVVYS